LGSCVFISWLSRRSLNINKTKAGTDFFSAKGARKGIGKFQLQRTNPENFAIHPFFYGDKLCMHAATAAFYQSLM
jgi:hypothetical protein